MTAERALRILNDPRNQVERPPARGGRPAVPHAPARVYTPEAAARIVDFLTIVLDIAEADAARMTDPNA